MPSTDKENDPAPVDAAKGASSTTKFIAAMFAALCVLALGWLAVDWIVK